MWHSGCCLLRNPRWWPLITDSCRADHCHSGLFSGTDVGCEVVSWSIFVPLVRSYPLLFSCSPFFLILSNSLKKQNQKKTSVYPQGWRRKRNILSNQLRSSRQTQWTWVCLPPLELLFSLPLSRLTYDSPSRKSQGNYTHISVDRMSTLRCTFVTLLTLLFVVF